MRCALQAVSPASPAAAGTLAARRERLGVVRGARMRGRWMMVVTRDGLAPRGGAFGGRNGGGR
jgi:hypothetical protein